MIVFVAAKANSSGPLDLGCGGVNEESLRAYHEKIKKLFDNYYLTHNEIKNVNSELIESKSFAQKRSKKYKVKYGRSEYCIYYYDYIVYEKKYSLGFIEFYVDEKFSYKLIYSKDKVPIFYKESMKSMENGDYKIVFDPNGYSHKLTTLIDNKYTTLIYSEEGKIKSCNYQLKKQ